MISSIIIYGVLISASNLLPESFAAEEPKVHQENPAPVDIPKDIPLTNDAFIAKKDDVPVSTEGIKIYHGNFTQDGEEVPRTGLLKLNLGALLNGGLQINKKVNVGLPSLGISVNNGAKIQKPAVSSSTGISNQVSVHAPAVDTGVRAGVQVPVQIASAHVANTAAQAAPQTSPFSAQQQVGVNVNVPSINVASIAATAQVSTSTTLKPLFAHAGLANVHMNRPISGPAVSLSSVSQPQQAQSTSLPAASLAVSVGQPQQAQPLVFPGASLTASVGQTQQVNTPYCVCPDPNPPPCNDIYQVQNGIRSPYSMTIGAPMGEAVQVSEVGAQVVIPSTQVAAEVQSNVQSPQPPPSAFQEAVNGGRFIGGLKGKGPKSSIKLAPQFSGSSLASASVSSSVNVSPQVSTAVQSSYGGQSGGFYNGGVAGGSYVSQSGPSYVHAHAVPIEFDNQDGQVGINYQEPQYESSIDASRGVDAGLGLSLNFPSLDASIGTSKQIGLDFGLGKSFDISFGK